MRLLSRKRLFWGRSILVLLSSLLINLAWAALPPFNLPRGVTPVSHEIYRLHMIIFYICCVIGAGVISVIIYSVFKFRRAKHPQAAAFHENTFIEVLWTVIPFILLLIMAVPATKVLMDIHDTKEPTLNIKITGYQWKWRYDYLDQGISFFSNLSTPMAEINNQTTKNPWFLLQVDHPLVLPIKEKIRLLVTANDVIHSWWVPELGLKQDAVPGYMNQNWTYIEKPGVYRGQCAELCGVNHAFMPIVVKAVTQQQFKAWVAQQKHQQLDAEKQAHTALSKVTLMTEGKQKYLTYCAACHQPNGEGIKNTFPAIAGSAIAVGPLQKHIQLILHGVSGTAMQAFGEQLDDTTLAAIVTYQRNAWGNDQRNEAAHHRMVAQAADVAKVRNGDTQ